MKRLSNFLPFLWAIFPLLTILTACSDEQISPTSDPISRGIIAPEGNTSDSNPTLISDWESVDRIFLNSGRCVISPWTDGCSSDLPSEFLNDVSSSRGWTMLFHTFQAVGDEADQNYMVFYNFFTGYLKVFYYLEETCPATSTIWFICGPDHQTFRFLEPDQFVCRPETSIESSTQSGVYIPNIREENFGSNISGASRGWNGFSYQVPSYAMDLTDCQFKIGAFNRILSTFEGFGNINANISGSSVSITQPRYTTGSESRIYQGLANYAGANAENFINGLLDQNKDNSSSINIGKDLLGIAASAVKGDIIGILEAGWAKIFGRSTLSHYETTTKACFSSEGRLTLHGEVQTDETSPIPTLSFNLSKVLRCQSSLYAEPYVPGEEETACIVTPSPNRLLRNPIPLCMTNLGTWSLADSIMVEWNLTKRFNCTHFENEGGNWTISGTVSTPTIHSCTANVKINPYIQQWVTKTETSVELMSLSLWTDSIPSMTNEKLPSSFYPNASFYSTLYGDSLKALYNVPDKIAKIDAVYDNATYSPGKELPEDGEHVFIQWGFPSHKLVGLVTVKLTINYNGNRFVIQENRIYPVKNIACEDIRIPTNSITLLPGKSWITNMVPVE